MIASHQGPSRRRAAAAAAVLATLLGGCGGSSDDTPAPTSAVPALAAGAVTAYATGDTARGATAFVDAAGDGYVLLSDDGDAPAAVLHVLQAGQGRRVPATDRFVTLAFERSQPLAVRPLGADELRGSYRARVGDQVAAFTVGADGTVAPAAGGGCAVTGRLDTSRSLGGARPLTLAVSGCGGTVSGEFRGIAWSSADTAPAAWQAVLENGRGALDLLAFR